MSVEYFESIDDICCCGDVAIGYHNNESICFDCYFYEKSLDELFCLDEQ